MSSHFTPPTPADLKARYPEFTDVADARIQTVLDEVALDVTDDWDLDKTDADGNPVASPYRAPAMLALTGHLLSQEGATAGDTAAGGTVKTAKVGDASVTFADESQASGGVVAYDRTIYGRRFLELRRLAFPSFMTFKRA